MVGHISNTEGSPDPVEVRIISNHGINPQSLRELIKGALDPLPVDPVPSRIVINNIVITKDEEGGLAFQCEVFFEGTQ